MRIAVPDVRHLRTAVAAIGVATALGGSGCSSTASLATTPAPTTTLPSYLACGAPTANLGELSRPRDRIQLRITTVNRTAASVTAGYEISSPIRGVGIGYPFVPLPPTLVLIHDDVITGVQPTVSSQLPPGEVSGQDPVLHPLPYRGALTLTRLCPGQSWPGVWRDRPSYMVAIVVTRLTVPVLSASDRLLSEAVAKP